MLRSALQVPAAPRTTAFVISVKGRELVGMASFERNFLLSFPSLDDHASIYDHVPVFPVWYEPIISR